MKSKTKVIIASASAAVLITGILIGFFVRKAQNCRGICAGCSGCANNKKQNSSYYIDKQKSLNGALVKKQKIFRPALEKYYSEEELDTIMEETVTCFNSLLKDLPYIGGDDGNMTEEMEETAMVLAFYRIQKKHGRTVEEIGNSIIESAERELEKYPSWLLHLYGKKNFSEKRYRQVRENCEKTQKKEYEYDWVTFYIPGDGEDFDYGFNHTECGIVKYLSDNEAGELIPYLCEMDFVFSRAFNTGLTRTQTLAEGGEYCDFRFKQPK